MDGINKYFLWICCTILIVNAIFVQSNTTPRKPHIIIILADDLGWNDVSFHGSSQIPTPNIDALAYNGIILNQHYVQALCTPSRSALMTGKYPIHTGLQHLVILEGEPRGLPLSEKLFPQYLKEAGYSTHAIGKWHLGFFRKEYTPTFRGFDTHYGYWQGYQDYFDHTTAATFEPYRGLDMRRNMDTDYSTNGIYSTDLYTKEAINVIEYHNKSNPMFLYLAHLAVHSGNRYDPFQAKDEDISNFLHIQDPERRTYAGMVTGLDQSVGHVVTALKRNGMLDNSIILFMSDNGAPGFGIHSNKGSNFPLRGMKQTPWEGGIRGVAAIWSPWFEKTQRVSSDLIHISDWLPTLCSAAGIKINDTTLDGVNQWDTLVKGVKSPRTEVLHNIDDIANYAVLRKGSIKYVTGTDNKGESDNWYGENEIEGYLFKEVLHSNVAVAFNGLKTKLQIKKTQNSNLTNNLDEDKLRIVTEDIIITIRNSASVKCTYQENGAKCNSSIKPCLFNITDDPCEQNNLAETNIDLLSEMEELLKNYKKTVIPPSNLPFDKRADPFLWNNTWVPWFDKLDALKPIEMYRDANGALSSVTILYVLIILSVLFGASAIFIKSYIFGETIVVKDNDLPEVPKSVSALSVTSERSSPICFNNVVSIADEM